MLSVSQVIACLFVPVPRVKVPGELARKCTITLAQIASTSSAVMLLEHSVHALSLTIALRLCYGHTSQKILLLGQSGKSNWVGLKWYLAE